MPDDTQDLINSTKKAAGWLTGTSAVKAVGDALSSKGETPAPAPASDGGVGRTTNQVGQAPSLGEKAITGGAIGPTVQTVGEAIKTAPIKTNFSEYQE